LPTQWKILWKGSATRDEVSAREVLIQDKGENTFHGLIVAPASGWSNLLHVVKISAKKNPGRSQG
jgi:hypothetical protein